MTCGGEGQRCGGFWHDFITGANINGFQRGLNGNGAGIDRLPVLRGVELGKSFAERVAMFAGKWLASPIVVG